MVLSHNKRAELCSLDDWFVIAITVSRNKPRRFRILIYFQDANFGRYQISSDDLTRAMKHNPKVNTALICIGEGAEASWSAFYGITAAIVPYPIFSAYRVTKSLPGRAFRVANTGDIPNVLRSILSTMVDR